MLTTRKLFPAAAPVFRAAAPTWRIASLVSLCSLLCTVCTEGAVHRGGASCRQTTAGAGARWPPGSGATIPGGSSPWAWPHPPERAPVWCLGPITLLVSLHYGDTRQTRARQPLLLCISRPILFLPSLSKSSRWDRPTPGPTLPPAPLGQLFPNLHAPHWATPDLGAGPPPPEQKQRVERPCPSQEGGRVWAERRERRAGCAEGGPPTSLAV